MSGVLSEHQIKEIRAHYDAPGRAYHNGHHLDALLRHFQSIKPLLLSTEAVELAIYYHDIVYDPQSSDNEWESMAQMVADLAGTMEAEIIRDAAVMIEATVRHELPEEADPAVISDCAYFLDMDLSILGAANEDFDAYEAGIRQEYDFVPEQQYCSARGQILERFLNRRRLYFTDYFSSRYEARARLNVMRSLASLNSLAPAH